MKKVIISVLAFMPVFVSAGNLELENDAKITDIAETGVTSMSVAIENNGEGKNGFGAKLQHSNFHLGIQLQTKYMWRGMEMQTEDAAPTLFPSITYDKCGFNVYAMGAYSINGKYAEVDLGVGYTYKWLTIGVNDYYYPTTNEAEDAYFKYKNRDTGHWFEGVVTIAPEKIPAYLTVSNFFAGADKRLDGSQAYSTYAELGGHYDFLGDNSIALSVGAAFNKSCYNGYTHDFSICNIEAKYTYTVQCKRDWSFPLSVSYILNPVFEKSHVNFSIYFGF